MADFDTILKFWAPVEKDLPTTGGIVLTRLFTDYPSTQQMFPKFKDIPLNKLTGNKDVDTHGGVVLGKLGEMLKTRGNHKKIIEPFAVSHAQKKIKIDYFNMIVNVIVCVLKAQVNLDDAGEKALRAAMKVIIDDIAAQYKVIGFEG